MGSCKPYSDKRSYYRYYDTPEGTDIPKKMAVTTRYGAMAGMVLGTYDVLMYSHAVGLPNVMRRYAFHVVPLAAMGATFAAVANGVQIARGKNDLLNYFLGGVACGPILAAYVGSYHGVVAGGFVLGALAVAQKVAVDAGVPLLVPDKVHQATKNAVSSRNDWTLAKDPKKAIVPHCPVPHCPKNN